MCEELLQEIELEIEEKYKIKNPIFIIHKKILSREKVIDWMKRFWNFDRRIKYKYLSTNNFELKNFYSDPSDQVCQEFIDNFFIVLATPGSSPEDYPNLLLETHKDNIFFKLGETIYTSKQIKKELFVMLKTGGSSFSSPCNYIPDPNPNKKRLIIGIDVMESHRIRSRIESGLVVLEYKD